MAVYVFGGPGEDLAKFAYESLVKDNISRFFWSYQENFDLNILTSKKWSELDSEEINARSKAEFLLQVKPGDYVVHVNVPEWGKVTAAQVIEGYSFQKDLPAGQNDGRHCLKVKDVIEFDRNDSRVHPAVSRRLKLQGAHWQIRNEFIDYFIESLERLRDNTLHDEQINFLGSEADKLFNEFANKIQKCNPGKVLESFMAQVFRNVPGVIDVKENGSGFKSDYGADLLITYKNGIADFASEALMAVQIKSYEGEIWDTQAVDQIKTALEYFGASSGLIVTTAQSTNALEEAAEKLSNEVNKPVYILAGKDLARFVMKYGSDLL